ncbi:ABC transporter permease [Pseudoxanthomonas sp. X-1]|uniref:ABC transporter permease n=1 Tax=Pseudoxanthomonas sp. X-1 TaxID=2571115 RepID=UPI00110A27FD|nr:ABC transporter permease [Pseudoxanthomonas sp. X-1]TMN19040.1 FtsX-like permease family protein [Pseudoxanthomonas sp. X-1]UAY74209.1 ABC transporter permease [Pseudoxanthomonas sp. X-1]
MFGYYLALALRSLRRNPVLTGLMVLSIAVGIGAAMTTLTVMRLLSGDPLPGRSGQIFYPQVDASPSEKPKRSPYDMLDYTSAMDLWRAKRADRQALVVESQVKLQAPQAGQPPLMTQMLATHADFFPMFAVPFAHGSGWSAEDDARRARVAVISHDLNVKLFGGRDSVGQMLRVRDGEVRIVGVLAPWRPSPLFYRVAGGKFSQGDTADFYGRTQDVFLPFETGLELNDGHFNQFTCWGMPEVPGHLQNTPCVWLQLWVELDTPAKVASYRRFVADYASQQQALGRVRQPQLARVLSLMDWLDENRVVPRDARLQTWFALAFLTICLFNTVGLLLAKFLRRGGEIGVRRALGASKGAIFAQCLAEAAVIGLAGGIGGLLLTLIGVGLIRGQPVAYADLVHLDVPMFLLTFALAVFASILAGLLPALRASRIAPAMQLKAL